MESSQAKQVMSELEKSMHGLDDENPDPRQMGSMMRKICEMTGEKVDEPMEEILRKLEEGVSPDQIEENMGSILDENVEIKSKGKRGRKPMKQNYPAEDYIAVSLEVIDDKQYLVDYNSNVYSYCKEAPVFIGRKNCEGNLVLAKDLEAH